MLLKTKAVVPDMSIQAVDDTPGKHIKLCPQRVNINVWKNFV